MLYAYMPTSFLPMIEKLPWHWFWCILTLLAIILNEVMPKSLRVMDRFRRFRGHCRLYYVDPLNSFWRLAYRSRATWSVGHFDAFCIMNGVKWKMTWLSSAKVEPWLCHYPSQETFSVEVPAGMDGSCSQILAFFQNLLILQLKEHESTCESSKRCKQNPSNLLGMSKILLRSTFLEPRKVILNDVLIILLSQKVARCFLLWIVTVKWLKL